MPILDISLISTLRPLVNDDWRYSAIRGVLEQVGLATNPRIAEVSAGGAIATTPNIGQLNVSP